jgi:CheY-like chemotaxis protein
MTNLAGLKVLVVEDEASIALLIEDMLEELGCEIARSVAHLSDACRFALLAAVDFAVLDLNLHGKPAFPVAGILHDRRIPFVFSTGYGASGVPQEFRAYPVLTKPFTLDLLRNAIVRAVQPPVGESGS